MRDRCGGDGTHARWSAAAGRSAMLKTLGMELLMKRSGAGFALLLVLLLSPVLAAQRWDAVLLADQGMYYMDPTSVEQQAGLKVLWTLLDYRNPQTTADGQSYRSMRAQVQINCKANMARFIHMSYHSGAMMNGKPVQQQGMLRDWHEIEVDSPIARIARRVC